MRISTKGRHAVVAMVDLTRHTASEPPSPVSLGEIAKRQGVSLSYLEQLVAMLKAAGLVKSVRGPGGGYLLACPSDQITVSEVIAAVDDQQSRIHIKDPKEATVRQLTDLLWQAIGDEVSRYLKKITLSDVDKCELCGTLANGPAPGGSAPNAPVANETESNDPGRGVL